MAHILEGSNTDYKITDRYISKYANSWSFYQRSWIFLKRRTFRAEKYNTKIKNSVDKLDAAEGFVKWKIGQ